MNERTNLLKMLFLMNSREYVLKCACRDLRSEIVFKTAFFDVSFHICFWLLSSYFIFNNATEFNYQKAGLPKHQFLFQNITFNSFFCFTHNLKVSAPAKIK